MALQEQFATEALLEIGERAINSFTDGSTRANVVNARYERTVRWMLSQHTWEFATVQAELSKHAVDTPLIDWSFEYELPAEPSFVHLVRVARTADTLTTTTEIVHPRSPERVDYAVRGRRIYSNYDDMFIEYVARVDEGLFPDHFIEALVIALAERLAMPLTDNEELQESMHKKLHGVHATGQIGELSRAKLRDSKGSPNSAVVDDAGLINRRW